MRPYIAILMTLFLWISSSTWTYTHAQPNTSTHHVSPDNATAATHTSTTLDSDPLSQCDKLINVQNPIHAARQNCLRHQARKTQAEMKALHKKIVVDIKKLGSSAGPQAIASLRASQNAFERFKAAQCQWIASATMGGTGAGDFQLACTIDLMRGRIQQLKNNWPI